MDLQLIEMTYGLFASQFTIVLTIIGIMLAIFGALLPMIFTLIQRKDLKDERERVLKEIESKTSDLLNLQNEVAQQKKEISDLHELLSNAYIALAQYYVDRLHQMLPVWKQQNPKEADTAAKMLFLQKNLLACAANSGDKRCFEDMLKDSLQLAEMLQLDNASWNKGVEANLIKLGKNNFIPLSALKENFGESSKLYKDFLAAYSLFYD